MSVLLRQAEINLNSAKGLRTVQDGVFFPVAVVSLAGYGGRYISKASVGENPFWNETFVWRIDNRLFESNMQILVEIFQTTALEAHVGTSSIELQALLTDPTIKAFPVVVYGKNQGTLHVSARISPPFKPEGMPQIQDPTKSPMHLAPPSPPPPLVPSLPRLSSSQNVLPSQVGPYPQSSPEPYRVNESFQSPSHSTSPGNIPPLSKSSPQLPTWKSQNLNQMLHQKTSSLVGIVSPFDPSVQKYASAQSNSTTPPNEADNKVQHEASSNSNSNNSGGSARDGKADVFKSSDEAVSSKLNSSPPSHVTETSPQPNSTRPSFSIPRHRNVFSRSSDSIEVDSGLEAKSDAKSSSVSRMSPGQNSVQPSTATQSRGTELNRRSTETHSSSPQRPFKSPPSSHSTSRNGGISRDRPAGLPSGSPQRSRSAPNPQPYHGEYVNGHSHGNDQLSEEGRFGSQQLRSYSSPFHSSVHSRHASNSSGDENGTSSDDYIHGDGAHSKHAPQKIYPSPSHNVNLRKDAKSNSTSSPDRTRSQTEPSPESASRRVPDSPVPYTPIKSFKQHPAHASPLSQTPSKQDAKYLKKSTSEPTQNSYNGGKTMSSKVVSEDRNLPYPSDSKTNQQPTPTLPGDNEHVSYRYGESAKLQSKSEAPPPEPSANTYNYPPQQPYPQPYPHSYSSPASPYPQPHLPGPQPYPAHPYPPPAQHYPPPAQHYPPPAQHYPPPAQHYPPNFPQTYPSPGYPQPPYPTQPYLPQPSQGHSQPSKSSSGLVYGSAYGSGHGYNHGHGNSTHHASYKNHGKNKKSHGMGGMGEMGAGLAVGALAGAVGGLALAEAIDGDFIPDVVDGVGDAFEAVVDGVDDAFDATVDAALDIW